VGEHCAELVVAHLAQVLRGAAERGDPDDRVRRRPAGDLDGGAHRVVDLGRTGLIDQRHRALRHPQAIDEVVALVADHVDEGVADPDHVELGRCGMGVVHGRST
jgi:hypothetical protein